MPANPVIRCWKRIDAWLADRVPRNWLRSPGLSESQITKFEKRFGHRLPDDVRETYKIHNGLVGVEIVENNCCGGFLLPLIELKARWPGIQNRYALKTWESLNADLQSGRLYQVDAHPKGPIQKVWWSPHWLPLFDNGQGDFLLLDLQPSRRGSVGQIIEHRRWDGPHRVVARSFSAWLAKFTDQLENGRYFLEFCQFRVMLIKDTVRKKEQREANLRAANDPEINRSHEFAQFLKGWLKTPQGRAYRRDQRKKPT